jgi:hypothetical protein
MPWRALAGTPQVLGGELGETVIEVLLAFR